MHYYYYYYYLLTVIENQDKYQNVASLPFQTHHEPSPYISVEQMRVNRG